MYIANINLIFAQSSNHVIGKDNDLPWNIPIDLKNFKKLTDGHPVIMGRKCWESIPDKYRPLPNRINIVLTRNKDYVAEGAEVRHDLESALDEFMFGNTELFIIGGAQIYKDSFEHADKVFETYIDGNFDGDAYLEGFDRVKWQLRKTEGPFVENDFIYTFNEYHKR
jgi:dihydrofolate reductase